MTYTTTAPFEFTSGPRNARILICGEAFGEQEEKLGQPFIGSSGQELTRMLREAGIDRFQCLLTNVLPLRPPGNKLEALCADKKTVGKDYPYPAISNGKYLLPEYLGELGRLRAEIQACNPNLIIAMGNMACWALLNRTGITAIRGSTSQASLATRIQSSFAAGIGYYKVLPTFHPAYILRAWQDRVIVISDLLKCAREAQFPEIRRPEREVIINPTLADIAEWITRPARLYAADIETTRGQIDMIAFARSRSDAICIPFVDWTKPDRSYWEKPGDEIEARRLVGEILSGPVPKLWQNGLYDMQFCWREGWKLRNVYEDTMLLHHAIFPEMKKGLGFLGSIYTGESSWKLMRLEDTNKRDE